MIAVSIDPGKGVKGGLGWGVAVNGEVLAADVFQAPARARLQALTLGALAQGAVEHIRLNVPFRALGSMLRSPGWAPDLIVIERMVQYPPKPTARVGARSRAAEVAIANDLLDLQAIAGLVAGMLGGPRCKIVYRRPSEWKGGLDWTALRGRLLGDAEYGVAPVLTPPECEVLRAMIARTRSLAHNGIEATALLVGELGRVRWA
jgi:hypothetical protein